MRRPMALALCLLVIIQCLLSAAVVSFSDHGSSHQEHGVLHGATSNIARHNFDKARGAEKPLLRLMPLGASITQGWDNGIPYNLQNGYRKPLRRYLRYLGYPVNMVGSRAQGDFFDRQHEGWPGLEIDRVVLKMLPVLMTQKPNLVLILVGSNDCFHAKRDSNMEYARSTKDRMRSLLEKIFTEVNGTTVILATLPPTRDPSNEPYINTANSGFKDLAHELQEKGRKIELADMYTRWLLPEDYSDSIHFNPSGYTKLAIIFARAFSIVEAKGWLTPPLTTDIPDSAGCNPTPKAFRGPVRTRRGSSREDGNFAYSSKFESSKDFSYGDGAPQAPGHFHFANLVQLPDELQPWDELIRVLDPEDRKAEKLPFVSYYTNKGDDNFDTVPTTIEVGQDCPSQNVRWADFNSDGLEDFICLDGDGIPHVSLNQVGNPPNFEFIGAVREETTTQAKVHPAETDGDGQTHACDLVTTSELQSFIDQLGGSAL